MKQIILILTVLLSQSHAMDYLRNWWSGETLIKNLPAYAEQCIRDNDHPILSAQDKDLSSAARQSFIPKTSLVHDSTSPSDIILTTTKGNHIRAEVLSLRLEHSFPGLAFAKQYPLAVVGGYAATFILPAMISTPIWTVGIAGGLGYTWWSNRDAIARSWNNLNELKKLSGIETPLEQALSQSQQQINPLFQPNGHIRFQGNIPNGIIPGQSLHVDMVVRPIAELSIS